MYNKKTISIVLPAYNEEENIKKAINEFLSLNVVDEVIVVDNNSTDKTFEKASKTKARLVKEKKQGYGWSLRRGMREASGDYIVTVEPDGTFIAKDLYKFLAYVDEFDVIFGTRTSKECIWKGANMSPFLRYGNVIVAKLLEYLHNGPCLTDVGCTFKLIKRKNYEALRTQFSVGNSSFSPHLMTLAIRSNMQCIEIPINYRERLGESKITGSFWKAFKLGIEMIILIISHLFKRRVMYETKKS